MKEPVKEVDIDMTHSAYVSAQSADVQEPDVTITMDGDHLVIQPASAPNRASTIVFVGALNAAVETDSIVVVDVDRLGADDALRVAAPITASDDERDNLAGSRAIDVEVVAPGVLRLPTDGAWWTIDLFGQRFCRTSDPVDIHFITGDSWKPISTMWMSPSMVSVQTTTGGFITTTRARRTSTTPEPALRAS